MTNVIVAFSRMEDAKNMKNVLMRNGFQAVTVCTLGAHAIQCMDGLGSGILICGWRFQDMAFQELYDCLPSGFEMILVASPARCLGDVPGGMVFLPMPLKAQDLINTLHMMTRPQMRRRRGGHLPKVRSDEERQMIARAKDILMERSHMSEEEAHRYIQKCSMDSGTDLVETALMVISLTTMQ